jgi:hypothetical protein
MAERTVEINLEPTASASDQISDEDKELNDFIAQQLAKVDKKRVAEVYERGVVGDRLHVELPPELVGQWVPNDTQAIYRMEALGYTIDTKFAPSRRLHDKGDGASYVGDVVHMIAPRIIRDIIDDVKRDRYNRIHAKSGKQKEEKDFEANNAQVASAGIKTISDSRQHSVDSIEEIRRIIDPGAPK